jgi:hypothetical protein
MKVLCDITIYKMIKLGNVWGCGFPDPRLHSWLCEESSIHNSWNSDFFIASEIGEFIEIEK